ncbi:major facilitator superfamily domain-containing protein [Obelidium mucronatum]|nr:major facilitator superfamily domain-containing protein [Obelidium mucronatum]
MSAISQSMLMLILGRVITGFGAGGMATLVNIIVSEICTAKERGKYLGILGMAYGLAFLLGPVNWRCFYINIPIGFFAIIVCIAFLQIDFLGSAMLLVAMVLIDTPLQLGGNQWRWDSIQSIAMMVGFIAIMIAFVHLEMNVIKNPLIPRQVFVDSSILAFIFISFCIGAALFSGLYYNALFFQFTFGDSAIESGIRTYPMVIGFILLTVVSGALFSRTGHYGSFFIIGPVLWGVGMISNCLLDRGFRLFPIVIVALLLLGIGCGTDHATSLEPHLLFVSTGLAASIVYVGGTMAVSTTGAILDNILLAKAHTNPVLQKMTETLSGMGIEVDYQQYMTVSKLLAKLASKFPSREQEFLAARVELTGAFNEGFKAATLSQLGFMVLILFCVPFIWQRKPRQSVSD